MESPAYGLLVPTPKTVEFGTGGGAWRPRLDEPLQVELQGRAAGGRGAPEALELLRRSLPFPRVEVAEAPHGATPDLRLLVAGDAAIPAEGYRLQIDNAGILIQASDRQGAFYAACTLAQCMTEARSAQPCVLPAACIEDAPDFARRGLMLDVSRDRVPTMETLFALVERMSRLKLNELQLYTEHTFAYSDHERVWRDASPLRAAELRVLKDFCRARFVDLVPNQQSLGHFHRWLIHEPYRHLAECPEGVEHPFATRAEPFSLAPTNPDVLQFVQSLHDELLENFESPFFNVGLDETFDIGEGASRAASAEKGKGRVYLDYLKKVHASVSARGLRMQFWGDVILEHPELVPELPGDAIAMAWGYDADHPFPTQLARFAEAGLDFYVCPGTSSWLSVTGRLENARANLESAASAGLDAGAMGYLITDWGDFGHWQPAPASYAPLLLGASRAWHATAEPAPLAAALDAHVFSGAGSPTRSSSGAPPRPTAGEVWTQMGELYRECGAQSVNGSPLFFLLRFAHEGWPHPRIESLETRGLERTRARITALRQSVETMELAADDSALIRRETGWALDVLGFACEIGRARLDLGAGRALSELAAERLGELEGTWSGLVDELRELWPTRSRPGGLEESIGRFRIFETPGGGPGGSAGAGSRK